jgi:DnaK suppressor protein
LARLDAGEYGECKSCGEPIAEARLKALPYVTLCIQCAEDAEGSS